MKFLLFGDSLVRRLQDHCKNYFRGVPGEVTFQGIGGLRAGDVRGSIDMRKAREERADVVFLHLGDNDICPWKYPRRIAQDIIDIAERFEADGSRVLVAEVLPRRKYRVRGLNFARFERDRLVINDILQEHFGANFVTFKTIYFPHQYARDGVHLSEDTRWTNNTGMRRYECNIRNLLCAQPAR